VIFFAMSLFQWERPGKPLAPRFKFSGPNGSPEGLPPAAFVPSFSWEARALSRPVRESEERGRLGS